jgi:uncharacterized protein (DUF302 family)
MMFAVHRSELDFDETVAALTESAKKHGWEIPMIYDLQEGYQEAGYEDMTKMKIIYLCNPHGGYKILQDDENKPMSVMMPMGVSVYETNAGQVYIGGMNLGRMSMMFGGTVKEVLREGAANYAKTLEDFTKPTEANGRVKDGGRCCLGCISVTAIIGALVGLVVVIAAKFIPIIMPKMMAKMMPKMMTAMEEADVQPPCAQIILSYLETQQTEK